MGPELLNQEDTRICWKEMLPPQLLGAVPPQSYPEDEGLPWEEAVWGLAAGLDGSVHRKAPCKIGHHRGCEGSRMPSVAGSMERE